jgi:hypothetical protein
MRSIPSIRSRRAAFKFYSQSDWGSTLLPAGFTGSNKSAWP